MSDFNKNIVRVFNCFLVAIPLMMAVFLATVYIFGGWEGIIDGHDLKYYILNEISFSWTSLILVIMWVLLIATVIGFVHIVSGKIKKQGLRKLFISVFIFMVACGIRSAFIYIFSEDLVPFSDFYTAWERAKGNYAEGNMNYYSLFPAYMNFSFYESKVINLFGELYTNVLYINTIYSGITAVLLFFVTTELMEKDIVGIISGILFALYPSNVLYIVTGTPEFLSILFNTLGALLLLKAYKNAELVKKVILSVIGGVSLGIGGSFKTYSLVMIIAFAMILISSFLDAEKRNRKQLMIGLLLVALVGTGYKVSSAYIMHLSSEHYGIELDTKTATPHYLLIGLNTEAEGQIHVGTLSRLYAQEYLANGMDYEAAKEYAYELLRNDWKNNAGEIIPNFGRKMIWAWQDDCMPLHFFLKLAGVQPSSTLEKELYTTLNDDGAELTEMMYLLCMICAVIGAIPYIKKKNINFAYEYVALLILGYFGVTFLVEGQSRYKCLVMPYVLILSGIGIYNVYMLLKKKRVSEETVNSVNREDD